MRVFSSACGSLRRQSLHRPLAAKPCCSSLRWTRMKRQLGFQMGLAGHRARRLPGTRPPVLSRRITGHCQAFTVSAFRVLVMEGDAEVVRGLCERVETRPRARPRAHPAVATRAAPRIDVVNPPAPG